MANITAVEAREMLKTARFSNFKIICEGFEFKVHKNILYTASPFFASLIEGPFIEAQSNECTIRETSVLAVAFLILGIYAWEWTLDLAYEVWPDLSRFGFLPEHPSEASAWDLNKKYESSLSVKKAKNMLQVQTEIRFYGLANRVLLEKLSNTAAELLATNFRDNLSMSSDDDEPEFADNARILLDIYQYTKLGDRLRSDAIVNCVGYSDTLERAKGDEKLVLHTIRTHPEMNNDWMVGMAVSEDAQRSHDDFCDGCKECATCGMPDRAWDYAR